MSAGHAYIHSCFTVVENGMEKQVASNPQSTSDLSHHSTTYFTLDKNGNSYVAD